MSESSESYQALQRQAFRRTVYHIWAMIQAGLMDEMSEAEYGIARILLEHPEYEEFFDDDEILDGREFDTGAEGNPFLHISIHKMVEDQLQVGRPEELTVFFDTMAEQGQDRHEIVHAIMKILVRLISDAAMQRKPLNVNRYRMILARYRDIPLGEVEDALEREFRGH